MRLRRLPSARRGLEPASAPAAGAHDEDHGPDVALETRPAGPAAAPEPEATSEPGSQGQLTARGPFVLLLAGAIGAIVVLLLQLALGHHGLTVADRQAAIVQATDQRLDVAAIYRTVAPSILEIDASDRPAGQSPPDGDFHGTGFVVSIGGQDYVMTNFHVVQGAIQVFVITPSGDRRPAEVRGTDPSDDIALLKVPGRLGRPLAFDPSQTLVVGDQVMAVGNPLGLVRSASSGIVSGLKRDLRSPNNFTISNVIEIDAAIDHGSSGGPLLDARGRVVGITTAIAAEKSQFGFAIPSDTIRRALPRLASGLTPRYAFLGVQVEDVTPGLAAALHLPAAGAMIEKVDAGGPAAKAGLKAATRQLTIGGQKISAGGDLIVAADGKPVASFSDLADAISLHQPGDKMTLTIYRGKQLRTVVVTLAERPQKP